MKDTCGGCIADGEGGGDCGAGIGEGARGFFADWSQELGTISCAISSRVSRGVTALWQSDASKISKN